MKLGRTIGVGLSLLAASADARPFIFISGDPTHSSWYLLRIDVYPEAQHIDGIPIDAINPFRAMRWRASAKLCHVEAVDRSSFVADREATRLDIALTFRTERYDPFRQEFATPDGRTYTARVGITSECGSGRKGGILLIYETATKRIVDVTETHDRLLNFIAPQQPPTLLMQSHFECDSFYVLYYDERRRKFRWI